MNIRRHREAAILIALAFVGLGCDGGTFTEPEGHLTTDVIVAVDPGSVTLRIGQERLLTAVVTNSDSAGGQNADLAWKSSDPEVATVQVNGMVRGIAIGTALITATVSGGVSDTARVSVLSSSTTPVDVDVVEFILGPQVAAGSHPWTAFDERGAGSAEKWADAFLNNTAGGSDYYDLGLALWQLHARTGDPHHLELAQQVAMKAWNGMSGSVDWGTNPTPYSTAPRSVPFAGLTLLALSVEAPVQTFNNKGTPVSLSLWEWLEGYAERMNGSWLERWDDPDSEGVHSGIRDGGMLLRYLAILAKAHPDEAVRTRMLDHAVTAARDYYARVQQQGEYAHGAWLWNVGQSTDATQPFQVGLLMEGLIATHQLTGDPEVERAIIDGTRAMGRDQIEWGSVPHPALSHKNMDASFYRVYGGDCDPPIARNSGCGNDMDPEWNQSVAKNKLRVKRHTNATMIHAFGYAWQLTGDDQFMVWGDRLMDSLFGDSDLPSLDTKGKEYNQVFRSSGRYLGWRFGS